MDKISLNNVFKVLFNSMGIFFITILLPICCYNTSYRRINGDWITTARNIVYENNLLCAELRTDIFDVNHYETVGYREAHYSSVVTSGNSYRTYTQISTYKYIKDCIDIGNTISLTNVNGKFQITNGTRTYEYSYFGPRGNWHKSATSISYFNGPIVCAILESNIPYHPYPWCCESGKAYFESCIDYTPDDYLINDGGKFKKINAAEYWRHIYNT